MLPRQRSLFRRRRAPRSKQAVADLSQKLSQERGKMHSCGLRHRFSCESWSPMAGLMWWLLRR
ncbi:MAG: hypothetical protein COC10_08935 [Sphingobium sp.]|nr:MAG: hypothetical protein COC10_08935 [Sphingobium sp.]